MLAKPKESAQDDRPEVQKEPLVAPNALKTFMFHSLGNVEQKLPLLDCSCDGLGLCISRH